MTRRHRIIRALDTDKVVGVTRELGEKIPGMAALRREIAHRIDPDPVPPTPRRAAWIAAAVSLALVSLAGWIVLARRPQRIEPYPGGIADPPSVIPPGDVDFAVPNPVLATRNGAQG